MARDQRRRSTAFRPALAAGPQRGATPGRKPAPRCMGDVCPLTVLSIDDLTVRYVDDPDVPPAVQSVSFEVTSGERLGLVGESGSGKTTTALAIMRLIKPPARIVSGRIRLSGRDITSLGASELRALRLSNMSYVPQGAMNSLNPVLTVGEQIADGMLDHDRTSRSRLPSIVDDALGAVGLGSEVARMFPHELSGGMKQRVCIAIGSLLNPELLIADEPTSALDVITQMEVMSILGARQRAANSAMLLIGHDMGLMAQFVDRVAVMLRGEIVEIGPTREIINTPRHEHTRSLVHNAAALHHGLSATTAPGAG